MGLDGQWSRKIKNVTRDGQVVHIKYDRDDSVYFMEDMSKFLKRVKEAYGDEIHGHLTVAKLRGAADFIDLNFKL